MKKILSILKDNADAVEKKIEEVLSKTDSDYAVLFESMRYSAIGGGKRIRPTLTLEFAKLLGADIDNAVELAAAVELVHTYSLIHDDLPCMDDDDERRGRPSNHVKFGEATALLAGDALLTLAFSVICGSEGLSDRAKVKAVKLLSDAAGAYGMIGGQQIDLIGESSPLTRQTHMKMNMLKTGALIKCAALMGCVAADADGSAYRMARKYAENIGLAFQVTDDLLDKGQEDGKTTYLTFMSEEETRNYAKELTDKAKTAVASFEKNESLTALADFIRDRKI